MQNVIWKCRNCGEVVEEKNSGKICPQCKWSVFYPQEVKEKKEGKGYYFNKGKYGNP